jgi:hypothetical protein
MIVKGNPGLGIQSTYDQAQTEKIGYANLANPVESSHDRANTHVHASGARQRRDHREQTACSERRGSHQQAP